ncbi:MerR family DNA-binding transcriptional regulator [Brevibacterium sp. FAM 27836]
MAHETAEVSPATGRHLTIAKVSELLRITAHTARYYERAGLNDVPRSRS